MGQRARARCLERTGAGPGCGVLPLGGALRKGLAQEKVPELLLV